MDHARTSGVLSVREEGEAVSVTKDLRKMLDEHAIKWTDESNGYADITAFKVHGVEFHAVSKSYINNDLDWVKLNVDSIAVEQIAELVEDHSECKECFATGLTYRRCKYSVNRGWRDSQCRNIAPKNYIDFLCSECHFVHYHNDEIDGGDDNDWEFCPKCGRSVKR